MDPELIDDSGMALARKSVLPGTGFFLPDEIEEERTERAAAAALDGAEVAVVADPDADGLACVALLRAADADEPPDPSAIADDEGESRPAERGGVAFVPAGPHDLEEGLDLVAEYGESGLEVYVCDLCPDSVAAVGAAVDALMETADAVHWYDHHQWDEDVAAGLRERGVDLVVGDSDEECSADVLVRSVSHGFDDRHRALAAVTRDHDLWLREDPRSDDLADYAYWMPAEAYVATVREHGPDLPEAARELLDERRIEKEALIEQAVERASLREVGDWTVGVTYGRCSQNEVAEALREEGADAAVIVKPAGSASLRGSADFERCHEVARQVNGGGHPQAAGCKPDIYEDMLDFAHHWTTRGAVCRQVILDAFRALDTEE